MYGIGRRAVRRGSLERTRSPIELTEPCDQTNHDSKEGKYVAGRKASVEPAAAEEAEDDRDAHEEPEVGKAGSRLPHPLDCWVDGLLRRMGSVTLSRRAGS